jgi:serine/threonine-protein kinase
MPADDKTRIVPDEGIRRGVQLNGIYEIDEHIATGGMGEVYRGHNIQTGDPVAIKVVLREFARDQGILALFRKEASILNHLSHDAIVRYHVFTIDPVIGRPYLAMEFVDGQSLGERLRSGPLDPQAARKMLSRVASGLSVAHEAGVIHRDLSPDNIVLPGGNVDKTKIIDFGIARSANIGGGTLLGGTFAGKYNFVSPEQLGLFGGEVTERSDIYSLGLVLAAALRGEPLDLGGSPVEVIEKRRFLPDLDGIDPGLRPLVEAMLQPDPMDRPQSAAEIVEWLRTTGSGSIAPSLTAPFPGSAQHADPGRPADVAWTTPPGGQASNTGSHFPRPMPEATGDHSPFSMGADAVANIPPRPAPPLAGAARVAGHRAKSGRWGLVSAILAVAIAVGAGGAYYSGLFDRAFAPAASGVSSPPSAPADATTGAETKPPAGTQAPAPEAPAKVAAPKPPDAGKVAEPTQGAPGVGSESKDVAALGGAPEKATGVADWFNAFDGGPCFYASVRGTASEPPEIDGLATSTAPFDKLRKAYPASGGEPAINARIIERDQCAVADFLKAVKPITGDSPSLELNKDRLKVGDSLQGKLAKTGNRDVNLLLIGKDGVVYNFAELLKKTSNDEATFSIRLFPLDDQESAEPQPHLIVALSSAGGIRSADIKGPELASDLFPKIRKEMEAQSDRPGVAVGYFLFGR